jgi:hypothetical protein
MGVKHLSVLTSNASFALEKMMHYIDRRRERTWDTFLRTEWLVLLSEEEYETVPTHIWAYDLVYDKLEPLLRKNGYTFSCTTDNFLNCLLNYMYRHIQDSRAMQPTLYMCKHACKCKRAVDAEEHFHSRKFPPAVWEQVRRRVQIEEWSDESNFAMRFCNICLANMTLWNTVIRKQ